MSNSHKTQEGGLEEGYDPSSAQHLAGNRCSVNSGPSCPPLLLRFTSARLGPNPAKPSGLLLPAKYRPHVPSLALKALTACAADLCTLVLPSSVGAVQSWPQRTIVCSLPLPHTLQLFPPLTHSLPSPRWLVTRAASSKTLSQILSPGGQIWVPLRPPPTPPTHCIVCISQDTWQFLSVEELLVSVANTY